MSRLMRFGSVVTLCGLVFVASCRPQLEVAFEDDGGQRDAAQVPDGVVPPDARVPCEQAAEEPCYEGPVNTEGVGICQAGTRTCLPDGFFGPCMGQIFPSNEVCDGLDNDCNGDADEELGCVELGDPCASSAECPVGASCLLLPNGIHQCVSLVSCTPPDTCEDGSPCVELPDGDPYTEDYYCLPESETSCWAHFLYDVTDGITGMHMDTCMSCNSDPALAQGSLCSGTNVGTDLDLTCDPAVFSVMPRAMASGFWTDFVVLDHPFLNPENMATCLVGWGVHPVVLLEESTFGPSRWRATVRLVGGANSQPLQQGGLTTLLPAAAFQQVFVEAPPLCSAMPPQSKSERASRVFWEEPSVTSLQNQNMPYGYQTCPSCTTWGDLVAHLYPGPEIFCQGLSRDPADSNFVVPLYLPYYDASWGTNNLAIVSELVCQSINGDVTHSVTANALPYNAPVTLPQSYPYP